MVGRLDFKDALIQQEEKDGKDQLASCPYAKMLDVKNLKDLEPDDKCQSSEDSFIATNAELHINKQRGKKLLDEFESPYEVKLIECQDCKTRGEIYFMNYSKEEKPYCSIKLTPKGILTHIEKKHGGRFALEKPYLYCGTIDKSGNPCKSFILSCPSHDNKSIKLAYHLSDKDYNKIRVFIKNKVMDLKCKLNFDAITDYDSSLHCGVPVSIVGKKTKKTFEPCRNFVLECIGTLKTKPDVKHMKTKEKIERNKNEHNITFEELKEDYIAELRSNFRETWMFDVFGNNSEVAISENTSNNSKVKRTSKTKSKKKSMLTNAVADSEKTGENIIGKFDGILEDSNSELKSDTHDNESKTDENAVCSTQQHAQEHRHLQYELKRSDNREENLVIRSEKENFEKLDYASSNHEKFDELMPAGKENSGKWRKKNTECKESKSEMSSPCASKEIEIAWERTENGCDSKSSMNMESTLGVKSTCPGISTDRDNGDGTSDEPMIREITVLPVQKKQPTAEEVEKRKEEELQHRFEEKRNLLLSNEKKYVAERYESYKAQAEKESLEVESRKGLWELTIEKMLQDCRQARSQTEANLKERRKRYHLHQFGHRSSHHNYVSFMKLCNYRKRKISIEADERGEAKRPRIGYQEGVLEEIGCSRPNFNVSDADPTWFEYYSCGILESMSTTGETEHGYCPMAKV